MSESIADRWKRKSAEYGVGLPDKPAPTKTEQPAQPVRTILPEKAREVSWAADLIPELEIESEVGEERYAMDLAIGGVTVLDAYERWCGKSVPRMAPGQREGIKVSCPNPEHPDKNPSAWINLDKDVFTCGGCGAGGDKFDIAAWHFGYPVPGYKARGSFPELRRKMAEDIGYTVAMAPAKLAVVPEPPVPEAAEKAAPVLTIVPREPEADVPAIDWRAIVPPGTFLYDWMALTSRDDLPEEYYFWLGLQALGFACGNDVRLMDSPAVKTNLFVCLYGPSGIGKTRSIHALMELLDLALPYDHDDPECTGTYLLPTPGSAEALIDCFAKARLDSVTLQPIGWSPVRGLIRFDELSNLVGKATRSGSVMKPTLMEMYDGYRPVETNSRGSGMRKAEGYFASAITTTQPGAIRELLMQTDSESGFINRWIFAVGPAKPLVDYGREPLNVQRLVTSLRLVRGWAAAGHDLVLDGDARQTWKTFFDAKIAPVRSNPDAGSLFTRIDLTLKKVIALFCANEMTDPTADLVGRATSLHDYLKTAYSMLVTEIGIGLFEDCRMMLGRLIRNIENETGHPPSIREINRSVARRYPRDLVLKVLKVMEEMNEVRVTEAVNKRGPATKRWSYVG